MTIRVFPNLSPRLILVRAPDTEITMQQLHDQVRDWEDEPGAMSYEPLITSAGKENLGGGVSVGITSTLQNAKVAFDMRDTYSCTGTATSASTDGSRLIDTAATFQTDGVEPGHAVVNLTDESIATVIRVVGEDELVLLPLVTGSDNQFEVGDSYKIWTNTQCEASGGNLVAVDENGDPLDAILPTTFIQVVRTASSAATQADLAAIQYASYQNAVWLDPGSANSGTDYPVGTRQFPVNNISDAVSIANERGFKTIQILDDITLSTAIDISDFTIVGQSSVNTLLTIGTLVNSSGVTVKTCNVTGVLDGGTTIRHCSVHDLTYVNGNIYDSELYNTIYVDGGADAGFYRCSMFDINNPPIIDMGGSGQDCIFADWSGNITFKNMTGANAINVQIDGGKVTLDSTVSAGTIELDGIGRLINNSTGTAVVTVDGLMSKETITRITWEKVWVDTDLGSPGTAFPLGTTGYPVDNMTDAKIIADGQGVEGFHVHGDIVLDQSYAGYYFETHSRDECSIDINGQDVSETAFEMLDLLGAFNGPVSARHCSIASGVTGIQGNFEDCYFLGTTECAGPGTSITMKNCDAGGYTGVTLDMVGAGRVLGASKLSGIWVIENMTAGAPFPSAARLGFAEGSLTLDSSCTGGTMEISGIVSVTDNSGAGLVVTRVSQLEAAPVAYAGEILLDTVGGTAGTVYPAGSVGYSVNSIEDAKTIADTYGIKCISFVGDITLSEDMEGYCFIGQSPDASTIDLAGYSIEGSVFKTLSIVGSGTGHFEGKDSNFPVGYTGMNCHLDNCILEGTFTLASGETLSADRCTSPASTIINLNGDGSVAFANFSGVLAFANVSNAASTIGLSGFYTVTVASSCTAGTMLSAGVGVIDNQGSMDLVIDKTVPATVWDQTMSNHQLPGSMGANQQHGVTSLD